MNPKYVPLESLDAEQAVLSAMLMSSRAINDVVQVLKPESFSAPKHQTLYRVIRDLHGRGPVEALILSEELQSRRLLDEIGGKDYIGELIDFAPTDANIKYHAKIVSELSNRREMLKALEDARELAMTGEGELVDLASQIQQKLLPFALSTEGKGYRPIGDILYQTLESLESRALAKARGESVGVTTGYPEIDDVVGGFRPGEFVGVFAGPKQGKTALTLCFALHNVLHGDGAGFVCAEMTAQSLAERCISAIGRIRSNELMSGMTDDHMKREIVNASNMIMAKQNFFVDDEAFPELGDVLARAMNLKSQNPNLKLLVVDYLQLITNRMKGRRGDEEINEVCKALKGLSKRAELVVIAPGQTNYKDVDGRATPKPLLKDVQGASGPAQTMDFLFLAHRPNMDNPTMEDVLKLELAASRRTARAEFQFNWAGEYMRVESRRAVQFATRSR